MATKMRDIVSPAPVSIPVVRNGTPVGVVSIGDLALEKDRESALSHVSVAPSNR